MLRGDLLVFEDAMPGRRRTAAERDWVPAAVDAPNSEIGALRLCRGRPAQDRYRHCESSHCNPPLVQRSYHAPGLFNNGEDPERFLRSGQSCRIGSLAALPS